MTMSGEVISKGTHERNKVSLIRIYQIMSEYSDAAHPLTQDEIIDLLDKNYGLEMERKAIKRNLTVLESAGVDIEYLKKGCYIKSRNFSDAELRLLIDSVLCSKHISASQSKKLIDKLTKLSNKYFKNNVRHICSVNDWSKTGNEAMFYNIELVHLAIKKGKKLCFDYNKYGMDKKLHKSSEQCVSPYQLILHNQHYYLMALYEKEKDKQITYFRLDRITDMRVSDENLTPQSRQIDYRIFNTQMPYMYSDKPDYISFKADIGILDQIIDWFGTDIRISQLPDDENSVRVVMKASPMAMKYWALQYLDAVEILTPQKLRDEIINSINTARKKYN